jgi:alpha-L-fucosidase
MRSLILVIAIFYISKLCYSQTEYEANWASIDKRPVPTWFEDAKFGIFIHWGLFSVPAWAPVGENINDKYAEWYWKKLTDPKAETHQYFTDFHNKTYGGSFKYQDFVKGFTCELFEPNGWATLFLEAGAKYVVLTSKHHEGFTLWPSAHAWNWNAVDVGPHRDLAVDLSNAVKAKGLKMGYYYSLYEWFNPLYHADVNRYVDEHMLPQLRDLVTRYKPDIVWTDGEWDHPSDIWKSTEFLAWLYNESPVKETVVVNDRWGKETRSKHGGIYTTEYNLIHEESSVGKKMSHPWEECRGIGGSFGYNRNENLADYSSSKELVHILIDKVARGGNLLLNIGPTADGRIPVIMQQRLFDIGGWLKVNGEAIYNTRAWDQAPAVSAETTLYFTKKGNDLYAICTKWPEQDFSIKGVGKTSSVKMLGYSGKIRYSVQGKNLKITPPTFSPDNIPCEYAWVIKIENAF